MPLKDLNLMRQKEICENKGKKNMIMTRKKTGEII